MSDAHADRETSLRRLLAHYDERVQAAVAAAADARTGTDRVRNLHVLSRLVSAHDSVLGAALCPLLRDLPGGSDVAERLRHGCEERESLLHRFYSLGEGTDARYVYPTFGKEVDRILAELEASFTRHVDDETGRVGELLESSEGSPAPEIVAARMAIEGGRAPARPHRAIQRHPTSRTLRAVYRNLDRMHDWNDSHHGWPSASTRRKGQVRPQRRFFHETPSVHELLAGYDQTVEALIVELGRGGQTAPARASLAYQLAAAIAVHDSVVGGTLCHLLEALPEGRQAATALREGCEERAHLLNQWDLLVSDATPFDLFDNFSVEANRIVGELIASFRSHERRETDEVSAVIEGLRRRSWSYSGTGLISPYLLPDWPNPEPAVLAVHMALWGEKSPTHSHPLLLRHPDSRLLRDLCRRADHVRDWNRARRGWPTVV